MDVKTAGGVGERDGVRSAEADGAREVDVAGRAAAALLGTVGAFQALLAAGAPWGAAAWGGAHRGVLPADLRVSSAVSVAAYAALAVVAARPSWPGKPWRRRVLTGAAALLALGTLMNLASPSLPERLIWTPVAASLSVLLWRTAHRAPSPAST